MALLRRKLVRLLNTLDGRYMKAIKQVLGSIRNLDAQDSRPTSPSRCDVAAAREHG